MHASVRIPGFGQWRHPSGRVRPPCRRGPPVTAPEVRIVRDWHEALNTGDVDRLMALSHPEVEVGGPRGTGQGAELLREWATHASITVEPRRTFHRAGTVVVEGEAQWRDADTGRTTGGQTVGSVFVVEGGRVSRVVRYPNLAGALLAAGLDGSYETPRTGRSVSESEVPHDGRRAPCKRVHTWIR